MNNWRNVGLSGTRPTLQSFLAASPVLAPAHSSAGAPYETLGSRVTPVLFTPPPRQKIMASTAAAQQRKAVLLEARMRGLTGSEASSAFAPAQQTSLDPPVTEVGFRSPSTSREGVSTKPASGSSSMTGVLPPGAPAPREPSPLKRKAGDGMGPPPARRKSAQPRKLPTKRASSDGGDERLSKAEAKASGLSQELERVREVASKEGEATRQKLQLTRDALEHALRATAEADARKARRDVADAAFELGRATYVAGSLGGRDAWEDGDAARRLKDREEELRRRREDETKVKRSIRESKKKGLIAASCGLPAALRHRRDSSPSDEVAGGFFLDFELFRTASGPRRVREYAVASMACSRPRRRDCVVTRPRRRAIVVMTT